jgi:hypothetical protein
VSPEVKWATMAVLISIAAAYFGVMVWRADSLARVLLRRGYAERGFTEPGLTLRLRLLGLAGFAISLAGLALCLVRILG